MPFRCAGRVNRAGSGGSIIGIGPKRCQLGLGVFAPRGGINIMVEKTPRGTLILMDTPGAARDSVQESDFR